MDPRVQLTLQQRQAVEAELAKRTLAHKRRVDRVKMGMQRSRARPGTDAAPAAAQLDLLAIGDSWFDYPLNGNDVSFSGDTSIVAQLGQTGSPPPLILSQALYGQATTSVLSYENQERIANVTSDPTQWINGSPDAILVSMGGDDLAGDQFAIYLQFKGSGLDPVRFQDALDSVQASYLDLFAFRDSIAPKTLIIGHCYDYAIPNGLAPACAGPWLLPSLEFAGYNPTSGLPIVSNMIDMFHDMLKGLAGTANNFVLIDTRNTLQRVASVPDGWANELHPFPTGFANLAQKFSSALLGLPAKSV
jgi:hypothetical protein